MKLGICITLVLLAIGGGLAYHLSAQEAPPGVIELDKDEALQLMNLETQRIMVTADRDELINLLCAKYKVTLATHLMD